MRESMLMVLEEHARANRELHKINIKVYLENPAGIGEYFNVMEAVQDKLDEMASHDDRLAIVENL